MSGSHVAFLGKCFGWNVKHSSFSNNAFCRSRRDASVTTDRLGKYNHLKASVANN